MHSPVLVLGAGIVGISCALELQRRGHAVTLLDRRGPGEETSSGNAGILSYGNITPLADPALWPRLPRLALNLETDFRLHYPHLPYLLPWLVSFLLRCRRRTYLRDGEAMSRLTRLSNELHRQWIDDAGLQPLLNPVGALKLYRERATFLRERLERELWQRCGVGHRLLDAREIRELEPDLKPVFAQGVLIEDSISVRDPQKLCQAYARLFTDAGGRLERAELRALRPDGGGWSVTTEHGERSAGRVVLCLGAWTPALLAPLGYANPLAIERGYNVVLAPRNGKTLGRPIFDVDSSYVMAPMEAGLRVTTGTNLVRRETRPDPRQVERVLPRVREAFPVERVLSDTPWMGRRPTLADSLPIVGPAPRHANLWLAFGHAHMGLTMGPVSGLLIANFISGEAQPFATDTCDPARYL